MSSYRSSFPLVIHIVSLHLSHSLLRGINESRKRRERKGREGSGSGEKESKKRHEMRSEQQRVVTVFFKFYHGGLRGAFEAGNVRDFDKGM